MKNEVESSLKKSLMLMVTSSLTIFTGVILGNALGLVLQIILGRTLGPELYGIYSLGVSIVDIVSSFAVLGMGAILARQIPRYLIMNKNRVWESINFAWSFSFVIGLLISSLLVLLSDDIALYVFKKETLKTTLIMFSFAIPFLAFRKVSIGILRGFKKPSYKIILEDIGYRVIFILAFGILVLMTYTNVLISAVIAFILSQIFVSIGYLTLTLRVLKEYGIQIRYIWNLDEGKNILKMSLPLFFSGFSFLFITYTDRIFLGIYRTSSEVGIYSAALSLATLVSAITASFNFLFLPLISEHLSKDESRIVSELYSFVAKWEFLLIVPVIIFFATNTWFLGKVYGSQYSLGAISLTILSMGISTSGFLGLAGNILVARGKTNLNLAAEIIGAGLNILLNYLLIPLYGIIGAAIATSISLFTRNFLFFRFSKEFFESNPYPLRVYVSILLWGFILFGYSYGVNIIFTSHVLQLSLYFIGICGYLIGLYKCGIIGNIEVTLLKTLLAILTARLHFPTK